MFVVQAWSSVSSYLEGQVVEDVRTTPRDKAEVPGLTVCPVPGFNKTMSMSAFTNISNYCDGGAGYRDCLEAIMYQIEDLLPDSVHRFPTGQRFDRDTSGHWTRGTINLAAGSCFTYQATDGPMVQSPSTFDLLGLERLEDSVSWVVYLHQRDRFLPFFGMSPAYAGQIYYPHRYVCNYARTFQERKNLYVRVT